MAEELTLEERVRNRGAIDRDEAAFASGAARVDPPGDELFPRSRFAVDEDGRVPGGDARDHFLNALHRAARADHSGRRRGRIDRVAKALQFGAEFAVLNRAPDGQSDELRLDRLREKIVRARAHRRDGGVEPAFTRHDDDRKPGPRAANAFAGLDSAHSGHPEIGEDGVELFTRDPFEAKLGRRARDDGRALALQRQLEKLAHLRLIIDNEDVGFHQVSSDVRTFVMT